MKRISAYFILSAAILLFFSCSQHSITTIGFYGVNSDTQSAFSDIFKRYFGDNSYSVIQLDDSVPLTDALKKQKSVSVVLSWYGSNAEKTAGKLIAPPKSMYDRYPTTVRNLSDRWIPLLGDHAEIAYRTRNLKTRPEGMPRTIDEMLDFERSLQGKENTARWPLVLAGQDDTALSLFLTSLMESTWDAQTVLTLESLITAAEEKTVNPAYSVLEAIRNKPLNEDGATFQQILDLVRMWREEGLLHPDWQTRKPNYVEVLMEDGQAEVVFMPLSLHRGINFRILQNFTDTFMPVNRRDGADFSRSLVVPALCAAGVHQKRKGADAETLALLEYIAGNTAVSEAGILSGLAPLASSAETADSQASNVRFYAAASDLLLQDLGSAFTRKAERGVFFEEIRAALSE